jgi:hypothetical protein
MNIWSCIWECIGMSSKTDLSSCFLWFKNILMGWWTHPIAWPKHTYSLKMIERQVITNTCREKDDDENLTRFLSFYIVHATVTDRVYLCWNDLRSACVYCLISFSLPPSIYIYIPDCLQRFNLKLDE